MSRLGQGGPGVAPFVKGFYRAEHTCVNIVFCLSVEVSWVGTALLGEPFRSSLKGFAALVGGLPPRSLEGCATLVFEPSRIETDPLPSTVAGCKDVNVVISLKRRRPQRVRCRRDLVLKG